MREMKKSHIPFCEYIPNTWNEMPNRYLFESHSSKVGDRSGEYQLLSLTTSGVKKKDPNSGGGKVPESYDNYQIVEKGDIIFCLFDLDVSAVFSGLSKLDGMITSAYDVFRARHKYVDDHYLDYWFQYVFSNRHYKMFSKNIRYTITGEMFKSIYTPVPSIEEQCKIGTLLDRESEKINALIANQEAQIEKLKQYKQSLITEVVTKGLDPDAPMKDSGVESIGKVPVHWSIKRTKFVAESLTKGNGITKEEVFDDGDIQCVRYGEIYSKYDCAFTTTFSRTKSEIIASPQSISYGDLLFAGTGELVEEIGKNIVYLGSEPCLAGGDIIVLKHSQHPEFLNYALYGSCSQLQKSKGKAKLKVVHISASEIGNVIVALPPIDEQKKIAIYLNEKCDMINRVIANKLIKIEKLNQYKKSLIYEYVTGKKEVI